MPEVSISGDLRAYYAHSLPIIKALVGWENANGTVAGMSPTEYAEFMDLFRMANVKGSARAAFYHMEGKETPLQQSLRNLFTLTFKNCDPTTDEFCDRKSNFELLVLINTDDSLFAAAMMLIPEQCWFVTLTQDFPLGDGIGWFVKLAMKDPNSEIKLETTRSDNKAVALLNAIENTRKALGLESSVADFKEVTVKNLTEKFLKSAREDGSDNPVDYGNAEALARYHSLLPTNVPIGAAQTAFEEMMERHDMGKEFADTMIAKYPNLLDRIVEDSSGS